MGFKCPICNAREATPYNGRANVRCVGCGAFERARMMWLALCHFSAMTPGASILHLAPEPVLASKFHALSGERYVPADFEPERWAGADYSVRKLDACRDLAGFATGRFDLILHNHVLEHLPCPVDCVLAQMRRLLAPGGFHMFSVPLMGGRTDEDLSPMTDADRKARFGQFDHMRLFGIEDYPDHLTAMGIIRFEPYDFISPELIEASGLGARRGVANGHSIFYHRA